ncbi:35136_t:CDS:2, partial [Gigaspora margarita]
MLNTIRQAGNFIEFSKQDQINIGKIWKQQEDKRQIKEEFPLAPLLLLTCSYQEASKLATILNKADLKVGRASRDEQLAESLVLYTHTDI